MLDYPAQKGLKEEFGMESAGIPFLDWLAEKCIDQFKDELFSTLGSLFSRALPSLPGIVNVQEYIHGWFSPYLQDHLIASFAYDFCCTKLAPKKIIEYADALFECTMESKTVNKNGGGVEDRKAAFRMKVKQNIKAYEKRSEFDPLHVKDKEELLLPPNWVFSIVMSTGSPKSPFKLKNLNRKGSAEENVLAYVQNEKIDYEYITKLISSQEYIQFLLDWQDNFEVTEYFPYVPKLPPPVSSIMHLCSANKQNFVAIPAEKTG